MKYDITKKVNGEFDEVVRKTKEALVEFGLGVVTEIDMKKKFAQSLDKEHGQYLILGACHPASAFEAIASEIEIGLLLPCNVVVYEKKSEIYVSMVNPEVVIVSLSDNRVLEKISQEVKNTLEKVLKKL